MLLPPLKAPAASDLCSFINSSSYPSTILPLPLSFCSSFSLFGFFCCPPTARQPTENKGINAARKQLHLTSISIPGHTAAQMNLSLKCPSLTASHCLADSIHPLQPHPARPGLILDLTLHYCSTLKGSSHFRKEVIN